MIFIGTIEQARIAVDDSRRYLNRGEGINRVCD